MLNPLVLFDFSSRGSETVVSPVLEAKVSLTVDWSKLSDSNQTRRLSMENGTSIRNDPIPNSTSDLLYGDNITELKHSYHFSPKDFLPRSSSSTGCTSYILNTLPPYVWLYALKYIVVPSILLFFMCKLWEIHWVNRKDKNSRLPLPSGRMGIPVIGEMFHFLILGVSFQRARRKEFGPIYRTHLFGRPTIRVSGEKFIKKLLLGEGQIVETKWPYTTQVILGTDGIVNGTKETHTMMKKLALRALSPRFMERYAPSVQRSVKNHVKNWNRRGEIFLLEECKQLIARTMMTVLLGIDENDPDIQKYIQSADDIINSILCIPLDLPYSVWRKGKRAREFIFEQLKTKLKAKMDCSEEELFGCSDVRSNRQGTSVDEIAASTETVDSVLVNIIKIARLEGESNIKLKNLQNLSLEIIFAGTQSLQSSSSLLILHLSQNPQVLEQLRKEIKDNDLWEVSLDAIPYRKVNSLTYLSSVVNECLRVTPPIPGAIRVAKKTFELNGFQVPKGWQVMFSIRETHEMASGQEKPLKAVHLPYNPDYFHCTQCNKHIESTSKKPIKEEEKCHSCHKKNGPFSFIPFGKGTRMCAGVNYALFVLRILAIEIARNSDFLPTTPIKFKLIPMTKPASTVKVHFQSRQ